MTYREFTRRNGTPLILKGPVTSKAPSFKCLRRTTRLPLKRPARRMRTAPGWREARNLVGCNDFLACFHTLDLASIDTIDEVKTARMPCFTP